MSQLSASASTNVATSSTGRPEWERRSVATSRGVGPPSDWYFVVGGTPSAWQKSSWWTRRIGWVFASAASASARSESPLAPAAAASEVARSRS